MHQTTTRSTPDPSIKPIRNSVWITATLPDTYLPMIVQRFLAATRRSSSFWIAALPTQGVQHNPPYWTIASSPYKASAAATSPRLSAASSRCASDAGFSLPGAGVDAARARMDANAMTTKMDLLIDWPPVVGSV